MYDLLVTGGRLLDGTGAPARAADVAVQDGRVAAIGDLSEAEAGARVDAAGRFVAPGFIDIHTHSDLTLLVEGRASSSVAQGITTQVVGNCGVSAAPTRDYEPYYGPLDPAMTRGLECDWTGFDGYFARLEDQGDRHQRGRPGGPRQRAGGGHGLGRPRGGAGGDWRA